MVNFINSIKLNIKNVFGGDGSPSNSVQEHEKTPNEKMNCLLKKIGSLRKDIEHEHYINIQLNTQEHDEESAKQSTRLQNIKSHFISIGNNFTGNLKSNNISENGDITLNSTFEDYIRLIIESLYFQENNGSYCRLINPNGNILELIENTSMTLDHNCAKAYERDREVDEIYLETQNAFIILPFTRHNKIAWEIYNLIHLFVKEDTQRVVEGSQYVKTMLAIDIQMKYLRKNSKKSNPIQRNKYMFDFLKEHRQISNILDYQELSTINTELEIYVDLVLEVLALIEKESDDKILTDDELKALTVNYNKYFKAMTEELLKVKDKIRKKVVQKTESFELEFDAIRRIKADPDYMTLDERKDKENFDKIMGNL